MVADIPGISQLGYDLHKKLAAEHGGAERWGYRALDTYVRSPAPKDILMSLRRGVRRLIGMQRFSELMRQSVTVDESAPAQPSPVPWLPHAISHTLRGTTLSTAQAMPNPLVKHLCSIFTSLPRATLLMAHAVGLTFSESSSDHADTDAAAERRVSGVEVQSFTNGQAKQTLPADAVVLAAGPWLGNLGMKLLGERLGKELNVWGAQANSIILKTKEPLTAQAVFAKIMMGGKEEENEPEVYCRPDGTTYLYVLLDCLTAS